LAEEKKIKIDISSAEEAGKKFGDSVKKGIETSLDKLDSKELQKKIEGSFSFGGVKENFAKAIKAGYAGTDAGIKKQEKMRSILSKNASLTNAFQEAISGGASKTEIMSKGLALAKNNIAGMAANMNPYVLAVKVAIEAAKKFLEYYQKTLEQSTKFISQGSLLTDKATMSMMQRTGQDAAGAQGTMRGLERLGLTLEDLQSGKVTKAQMEMFEQIRKEESARLREIQKVGMPTFIAMQKGSLAVAGATQKIRDAVTMVYAKSRGVMMFAQSLTSAAENVGGLISTLIGNLAPVFNIIAGIMGVIVKVVSIVSDVLNQVHSAVAPIYDAINEIINTITDVLGAWLGVIGRLINAAIKPAVKAISLIANLVGGYIKVVMKVINMVMEQIFRALEPFLIIVEMISSIIAAMIPMFDILELFTPLLEWIGSLLSKIGDAVIWIASKALKAIKTIWDGVTGFLSTALNLIPKAFHDMIRGLVKVATLGVKDIGEYQGKVFDLGAGVSNSLDNAIKAIEGDTYNYNFNAQEKADSGQQNANQNLFTNMYAIVND
jgi:phage-related protein